MRTYTRQRNRAFADVCLRMAENEARHGRRVDVDVIIRRAIYTRAAGFYLSYERALRLIYNGSGAHLREDGIENSRAQALRRQVEQYRAAHPRASLPTAVAAVLTDSAAPRYYFRADRGRRILADEVRRRMREGVLPMSAGTLAIILALRLKSG